MTSPIAALGEALYGPIWQARLARDILVHPQTVFDWAHGINAPGAKTREALGAHARKMMRRASADAEEIRAALEIFEATEVPQAGRRPRLEGAALEKAVRLWADPEITVDEVVRRMGIARATLYRALGPRGRKV